MTVTLVKAVAGQVQSLADASSGLADAAGALTTEWASIRAGIADFRDEVSRASDASDVAHLITGLEIAQQNWNAVAQQSRNLMARLVDLTPKDVKDLLEPATLLAAA
jgi:hypothetical protein